MLPDVLGGPAPAAAPAPLGAAPGLGPKVATCDATGCDNNRDGKCLLDEITVSDEHECVDFAGAPKKAGVPAPEALPIGVGRPMRMRAGPPPAPPALGRRGLP